MIDTYLRIARDLFSYQEFWGVFKLLQASLWVTILVILTVVLLHILYMLGYQTPLYRRRSPRANWSKQFFRGAGLVLALIVMVLYGLEWAAVNIEPSGQKKTIVGDFLKELKL